MYFSQYLLNFYVTWSVALGASRCPEDAHGRDRSRSSSCSTALCASLTSLHFTSPPWSFHLSSPRFTSSTSSSDLEPWADSDIAIIAVLIYLPQCLSVSTSRSCLLSLNHLPDTNRSASSHLFRGYLSRDSERRCRQSMPEVLNCDVLPVFNIVTNYFRCTVN